jgi:hypothetical protein
MFSFRGSVREYGGAMMTNVPSNADAGVTSLLTC